MPLLLAEQQLTRHLQKSLAADIRFRGQATTFLHFMGIQISYGSVKPQEHGLTTKQQKQQRRPRAVLFKAVLKPSAIRLHQGIL
ncbi:hypothetical protein D3C87_1608770 [compost metagenome]